MSERMNKEQAKNIIQDFNKQIKDYGEDMMPEEKELSQALDIAIECMQDQVEWKDSMTVEELEKMEKKALEDYGGEEIKKAVSRFSKTIKQINNRIQGKDNGWVEIKNELPSEYGMYLTQTKGGSIGLDYWQENIDYYDHENFDSFIHNETDELIAWKKVEPYERKE